MSVPTAKRGGPGKSEQLRFRRADGRPVKNANMDLGRLEALGVWHDHSDGRKVTPGWKRLPLGGDDNNFFVHAFKDLLFIYVCGPVYLHSEDPHKQEEGIGSPETRVAVGCEPPDADTGR